MFDNLTTQVPSGARRGGQFRLPAEQEAYLDAFVEWLQDEGKTKGTAQSYRSHVAKAQYLQMSWEDMSSDIRSAVKAMARYTESLA
jgi:hypothetical protein